MSSRKWLSEQNYRADTSDGKVYLKTYFRDMLSLLFNWLEGKVWIKHFKLMTQGQDMIFYVLYVQEVVTHFI